jgi:hypothetical protein
MNRHDAPPPTSGPLVEFQEVEPGPMINQRLRLHNGRYRLFRELLHWLTVDPYRKAILLWDAEREYVRNDSFAVCRALGIGLEPTENPYEPA